MIIVLVGFHKKMARKNIKEAGIKDAI